LYHQVKNFLLHALSLLLKNHSEDRLPKCRRGSRAEPADGKSALHAPLCRARKRYPHEQTRKQRRKRHAGS
jgi:hypothetical protein